MEEKKLETILNKHTVIIEKRLDEQTKELERHQQMLLEESDRRWKILEKKIRLSGI